MTIDSMHEHPNASLLKTDFAPSLLPFDVLASETPQGSALTIPVCAATSWMQGLSPEDVRTLHYQIGYTRIVNSSK